MALSAYEVQRNANIAVNNAALESLGLPPPTKRRKPKCSSSHEKSDDPDYVPVRVPTEVWRSTRSAITKKRAGGGTPNTRATRSCPVEANRRRLDRLGKRATRAVCLSRLTGLTTCSASAPPWS